MGWTDQVNAAAMISQQLASVGVHVSTVAKPLPSQGQDVADGDYDMVIASGPPPSDTPWSYFDAVYHLPPGPGAGLDPERYLDPAAWALVQQAAATPSSDKPRWPACTASSRWTSCRRCPRSRCGTTALGSRPAPATGWGTLPAPNRATSTPRSCGPDGWARYHRAGLGPAQGELRVPEAARGAGPVLSARGRGHPGLRSEVKNGRSWCSLALVSEGFGSAGPKAFRVTDGQLRARVGTEVYRAGAAFSTRTAHPSPDRAPVPPGAWAGPVVAGAGRRPGGGERRGGRRPALCWAWWRCRYRSPFPGSWPWSVL